MQLDDAVKRVNRLCRYEFGEQFDENFLRQELEQICQIPNPLICNSEGARSMSDKERDALMRLTMCARNGCVICKYKNEYTDIQCYELQTKCMNILAESLNRGERKHEG